MSEVRVATMKDYNLLQAERDRLAAKLEMAEAVIAGDNALIAGLKNDVKDLAAENKRLQEALEQISSIEDEMYGGDWDEIEKARIIARAALKEKS